MSPTDDQWNKIDRLLEQALALPAEERAAFVERECDDPQIRRKLQRMLARAGDNDLALPGATALEGLLSENDEPSSRVGQTIGRFRIVKEIGRGGMAVVFLAERADGEFDQQVALKLIKRGIDTDEVLQRFAQERQILAASSHPNIAKLLDGGTADDGLPFFAMEYIDGLPIDRYCDERRLSIRERLTLFQQVAGAIAYAHRNLVIHRDIKPSNILVAQDGAVKLLDFGIARYVEAGGDPADPTVTERRFLTPSWSSPEQVQGMPVTTASDVYQLGLLLYRLLTGRSPYRGDPRESDSLKRAICEEPPTRPSAAATRPEDAEPGPTVETISHDRGTSPSQLTRDLAGDLDNIILKALRKEPERRYASVAQLIGDIECYETGRPVSARPDTFGYRFSKLVGRHRVAATFAGLALAALIALAATMTFQAGRIARERDRAQTERDRANLEAETAERVSGFLVDLFEVSNPSEARGNEITARELLDRGATEIDKLDDQPELQGRLKSVIGKVYQNVGLHEQAEALMTSAVELRREVLGGDHEETLETLNQLGTLYREQNRYEEAIEVHTQVADASARTFGEDHEKTLTALGNLATAQASIGEFDESEKHLARVYDAYLSAYGAEDLRTLKVQNNLGILRMQLMRLDDAQGLLVDCLETTQRVHGDDHPLVTRTMNTLANLAGRRDRHKEASDLLEQSLKIQRRIFGPEHPSTLTTMHNLCRNYSYQGRYDDAQRVGLETLEIRRRVLGPGKQQTLTTIYALAENAFRQGDIDGTFDRLDEFVSAGPRKRLIDTLEQDEEFQPLHADPRFTKLIENGRKNQK